jgi:signal transduction histidine kinase
LLNDLVGRYQILAKKKEITLTLNVKVTSYVAIDIALMERAIQNLIENALKFTPEQGSINLEIQEDNNFLKVSIQDTGVGIEEEYLPFVFDRYKKVNADKENNPGAGLGLAIVKKIMEMHEVNITVDSVKGEGTVFSFMIPNY